MPTIDQFRARIKIDASALRIAEQVNSAVSTAQHGAKVQDVQHGGPYVKVWISYKGQINQTLLETCLKAYGLEPSSFDLSSQGWGNIVFPYAKNLWAGASGGHGG